MSRFLAVAFLLSIFSSRAFADNIGVYADVGTSNEIRCGFTSTVSIIHKFSLGSTGSRFRLDVSEAPGSTLFAFNSPFYPVGTLSTDLSIGYGECLYGSVFLGTIVAILGHGTITIRPAVGVANIVVTDCSFAEHTATGGNAFVTGNCPVATQPSTWGRVKALYRN